MDDFGLLTKDLGLRPQGLSAPMSASRSAAAPSGSLWNSGVSLHDFSDAFGGAPKPRPAPPPSSFDSIFHGFANTPSNPSSMPVNDEPVYDDVPGVKRAAPNVLDDVFAGPAAAGSSRAASPPMDDLLESLGRLRTESKGSAGGRSGGGQADDLGAFEELIPGFGGSSPPERREPSQANHKQSHNPSAKSTKNVPEDPFVVLETISPPPYSPAGLLDDPLDHISMHMNSKSTKVNASSASEGVFDGTKTFDGLTNSVPLSTVCEKDDKHNEHRSLRNAQNVNPGCSDEKVPQQKPSIDHFERFKPEMQTVDDHLESNDHLFEKPSKASYSSTYVNRGGVQISNSNSNGKVSERDVTTGTPPWSNEAEDVWLTVAEIPLLTPPTTASPPSRPPPSLVIKLVPSRKVDHCASLGLDAKRKTSEPLWQSSQSNHFAVPHSDSVKVSGISPVDELENFAMGRSSHPYVNEHADIFSNEEEFSTNSAAAASAAAMKEAMDRAEAKFRQAREARDRERDAKSTRHREPAHEEGNEKEALDVHDQEDKERQERLDCEQRQREREEKEKEQRIREKEREQELERERVKARQAVERATREARERAAAEARFKAERAAVEKANSEARQRAERAAVQRAAAEARERAERAAAEVRERVTVEARERAAVARAASEARLRAERAAAERVATEARERAAASAAREKQYKNDNDLESFFGMGARANSAPRQRTETVFDAFSKVGSDGMQRTSVGSSATVRRASSITNINDDLTAIFGAVPSSGEFQEVEGESEERRRARLERQQRTLERTAKALAEKNERDLQAQREQAERDRIAESTDAEIKRWAAGKEGNLRALLSTLQFVLWPECGWQPVSLTDLITSASVKKVYRKATLCIHPDKVQQKGADIKQKYVAEKVFDLLKEAWNKFNSEELF